MGNCQVLQPVNDGYNPLNDVAYPMFFPHATLGWGVVGSDEEIETGVGHHSDGDVDGATRQIMHYRSRVLREPRFQIFGHLTNEYLVDMFSRNLETRLNYIRMNQKRLWQEDASLMGVPYVPDHQNIYLPASFLGSKRWASEQIADSLAISRRIWTSHIFRHFHMQCRLARDPKPITTGSRLYRCTYRRCPCISPKTVHSGIHVEVDVSQRRPSTIHHTLHRISKTGPSSRPHTLEVRTGLCSPM